MPFSDLIQEANLALMRAVDNFDPTRGNKFSTYAFPVIHGRIIKTLYNQDRMIRIPVHLREKLKVLKRAEKTLTQKHNRKPTIKELASHLNWSTEIIENLHQRRKFTVSLNQPAYGNPDASDELGEVIPNDESPVDERVAEIILKEDLLKILEKLPERERQMIMMRFAIGGMKSHTLAEIGEKFNLTRQRIRQIIVETLEAIPIIADENNINLEDFL